LLVSCAEAVDSRYTPISLVTFPQTRLEAGAFKLNTHRHTRSVDCSAKEHVRACLARVRCRITGIATSRAHGRSQARSDSLSRNASLAEHTVAGLSTILISRNFVLSSHNRKRGVKGGRIKILNNRAGTDYVQCFPLAEANVTNRFLILSLAGIIARTIAIFSSLVIRFLMAPGCIHAACSYLSRALSFRTYHVIS